MDEQTLVVGTRVIRKSNSESGFIHAVKKNRAVMIEVRWEASGVKAWLPAEEVRLWDKLTAPPEKPLTAWGRTTPRYLVGLRHELSHAPEVLKDRKKRKAKLAQEKLADALVGLSDRKNKRYRTKAKAKKIINRIDNPRKPPL